MQTRRQRKPSSTNSKRDPKGGAGGRNNVTGEKRASDGGLDGQEALKAESELEDMSTETAKTKTPRQGRTKMRQSVWDGKRCALCVTRVPVGGRKD